jgi:short-subunit dehydrogenase
MRVLVTGSTRGLGFAILSELFKQNHEPIMNGRNLIKTGFEFFHKDVADMTVDDLLGLDVDVVINNAFDKNNNAKSGSAQIRVLQTSLSYFVERMGGTIININSVAVFDEHVYGYSAAKKALKEYSTAVKVSAYQSGVKIIDVYPGAIQTDWTKQRKDWRDLIKPDELAEHIVNMLKPKSFYYDEVIIRRPKC